jgi:hypothetical protein
LMKYSNESTNRGLNDFNDFAGIIMYLRITVSAKFK